MEVAGVEGKSPQRSLRTEIPWSPRLPAVAAPWGLAPLARVLPPKPLLRGPLSPRLAAWLEVLGAWPQIRPWGWSDGVGGSWVLSPGGGCPLPSGLIRVPGPCNTVLSIHRGRGIMFHLQIWAAMNRVAMTDSGSVNSAPLALPDSGRD